MKIDVCDSPIFVVGAPRSGTSMLQWALRQHPELWGSEESDFLEPLLDGLERAWSFGRQRHEFHWLYKEQVSIDEFLRHAGYGMNSLYSSRAGGRRWVETTPRYTLKLEGLASMFPDAVFLFLLRDGRQVVDSLTHFVNPQRFRAACRTWRQNTEAGLAFSNSPWGHRLLQVRFEEIVVRPEEELKRIFRFLELEPEPASVSFIADKPPINSSFPAESSIQKLGPRWLSWSRGERLAFHRIAGDLLIQLEFEPNDSWLTASTPQRS